MRLLLAIFLLLPFPVLASDSSPILILEKTYQEASSWQADFTQSTFVALLGKNIVKNGAMFLKKPGKLRITYRGGKTYISDNRRLWIYTEGDSQVELYNDMSSIVSREALAFLKGLGELKKDFWVSLPKTSAVIKDPTLQAVELKPRKNSAVKKIILGVDEKTGLVRETLLFNESGNQTRYQFKNIRINPVLGDSLFEFKKPPGVTIISGARSSARQPKAHCALHMAPVPPRSQPAKPDCSLYLLQNHYAII